MESEEEEEGEEEGEDEGISSLPMRQGMITMTIVILDWGGRGRERIEYGSNVRDT